MGGSPNIPRRGSGAKWASAAAVVLVAWLAGPVEAVESEFQEKESAIGAEYDAAKRAIARQDWKAAVAALERAAREEPNDADVQNLLGFALRKSGELDRAFRHYGRALQLNPGHLGAHEYVGEAWLLRGNVAKAREHLAALEKLCPAKCEEREDLKRAIEAYVKR